MGNNIKGILFYGFGGHARSIADVALSSGIESLIFVDDNAQPGESFAGFPVRKTLPNSLAPNWIAFPASGNGVKRSQQLEDIRNRGWSTGNIIAHTATVGVNSRISQGCFLGNHTHIGPNTLIGDGCIINTGAIVEHDCIIGNYSHLAVNCTIAGKSAIGCNCFIGAGSTIIDGICVGDDITLGAGGVIARDTLHSGIYVGIPARLLREG